MLLVDLVIPTLTEGICDITPLPCLMRFVQGRGGIHLKHIIGEETGNRTVGCRVSQMSNRTKSQFNLTRVTRFLFLQPFGLVLFYTRIRFRRVGRMFKDFSTFTRHLY